MPYSSLTRTVRGLFHIMPAVLCRNNIQRASGFVYAPTNVDFVFTFGENTTSDVPGSLGE